MGMVIFEGGQNRPWAFTLRLISTPERPFSAGYTFMAITRPPLKMKILPTRQDTLAELAC